MFPYVGPSDEQTDGLCEPLQTRIDPPEGADSEWYLLIPLMRYHR